MEAFTYRADLTQKSIAAIKEAMEYLGKLKGVLPLTDPLVKVELEDHAKQLAAIAEQLKKLSEGITAQVKRFP